MISCWVLKKPNWYSPILPTTLRSRVTYQGSDGKSIATVEGLDSGGTLSAVQQAFIDSGAFQCGFCTPGFVLMTKQLLDEHPDPTDDQIGHYLSGNLCRCGTYPEIIAAVKLAARKRRNT